MKLSTDQHLALCAAILPLDRALLEWDSLVSRTPIESLDGSITRILPAIYQNLRSAPNLRDADKMKGSHRFAWAKNTEFISHIKPLLLALPSSHIDYRILKGGAINFLLGSLGSRSMGDIDILVRKRDLRKFEGLLAQTGFKRKFSDSCPHVEAGDSDQELNYINSANIEIDLHVMENRRPAKLFKLIMDTPAYICDFMGLKIQLPTIELLILHSIYHGSIRVQSSDEVQSLLDIHRLLPLANKEELVRLSRSLHFNDKLVDFTNQLENATGEHTGLHFSDNSRLLQRTGYALTGVMIFLERLGEFFKIRRSRAVRNRDILKIARKFPGHRLFYAAWLAVGKLRPLERLFCIKFKGFLAPAGSALILNQDHEYSPNHTHNQVRFNPFWSQSQDWRFAFTLEHEIQKFSIYMISESLKRQSFLVFINGQISGVTERSESGTYQCELSGAERQIEISLRLPANGCEKCARKLEDLVLQFA